MNQVLLCRLASTDWGCRCKLACALQCILFHSKCNACMIWFTYSSVCCSSGASSATQGQSQVSRKSLLSFCATNRCHNCCCCCCCCCRFKDPTRSYLSVTHQGGERAGWL
jgi:hypothetical protein